MAIEVADLLAELNVKADVGTVKKFSGQMRDAGTGASKASRGLKIGAAAIAAVGAAAVGTAAALVSMTRGFAAQADEIVKSSKQLNVNAEQYQRMRGAIELSGGSVQDLDRGLRTLTKGLSDAADKGTGPAADALEALGLTVSDVEGELLAGDIEGILGKVGDAFNKTGDSAEKNAALMNLFGARAGAQLRPLLEEGSAGIRKLGDDISRTGGVIEEDALGRAEELQDAFTLLDKVMFGLKGSVADALAPAITQAADGFREWILENDELIRQDLPEFIGIVIEAGKELLPVIIGVVKDTKDFVKWFREAREESKAFDLAIRGVGISMDLIVKPIMFVADLIRDIAIEILSAAENLGFFVDEAQRAKNFISGGPSATEKAVNRANEFKELRSVNEKTNAKQLEKVLTDPRATEAVKAKAQAFLPSAVLRESAERTKANLVTEGIFQGVSRSRGEVEELQRALNKGRSLTAAQRRRAKELGLKRERRKGKGKGGSGGKATGSVAEAPEESLDDLINAATGENIDRSLPDVSSRAPTVVIQITRNDVRLELTTNFPNVSDGDSAAQAVVNLIREQLVQQNVKTGQAIAPNLVR